MKKQKDKKVIVIVGATASGKSALAVSLALRLSSGKAKKEFKINGAEIISADSRQVYRGMDVGTGKITPDTKNSSNFSTGQVKKKHIFTHKGIPHYCIDVASPKNIFTVTQYRRLAIIALNKIIKNGKTPIICGGTGFYIQALVDGIVIPKVAPDWKLRKKLEKKSKEGLYKILKKLDPKRAKNIDKFNPRRLIRAIEIVMKTKKPIPILKISPLPYPVLFLGIKKSNDEIKKLIKKRLAKRLRQGMIAEIKKLHESGVAWKRLEEFGLEYRYIAQHLQKKLTYEEMINRLQKESEHYAKRQMTWLKRDKRIKWVKNYKEAKCQIKKELL